MQSLIQITYSSKLVQIYLFVLYVYFANAAPMLQLEKEERRPLNIFSSYQHLQNIEKVCFDILSLLICFKKIGSVQILS